MRQWLGVVGIAAFSSALTYSLMISNPFFMVISALGLILSISLLQNHVEEVDLTDRQYAILSMLRNGYSKRDIARKLNISTRTLYNELSVLIDKGLLPPETVSRRRLPKVNA